MKARIVKRTNVDGVVSYTIQQRHLNYLPTTNSEEYYNQTFKSE